MDELLSSPVIPLQSGNKKTHYIFLLKLFFGGQVLLMVFFWGQVLLMVFFGGTVLADGVIFGKEAAGCFGKDALASG